MARQPWTESQHNALEPLCEAFEAAWRRNERPSIPDAVHFVPTELRPLLVKELVQIDYWWRTRQGEQPAVSDYRNQLSSVVSESGFWDQLRLTDGSVESPAVDSADGRLISTQDADPGATVIRDPNSVSPDDEDVVHHSATSEANRFRILRPFAKGGLGEVYVAFDGQLRREVALKEIQSRYAHKTANQQRFLSEAEITGNLEHPGIVPVYGLGHYADGRPYYAMRLIRGSTLRDAIDEFHQTDWSDQKSGARVLQLRKLLGRFIAVCNAVSYAHSRGVLHRDLKPGNIMLGKYGETLVVDWGLAKLVGSASAEIVTDESPLDVLSGGSSETLPGSAIGTPAYMSPEQAAGKLDELGPATDIYSLGATLYQILTGRPPFELQEGGMPQLLIRVQAGQFPRPREAAPDTPPALEAICLKAMSRQAVDRFVGVDQLTADLENWLADEPVQALREPLSARLRRWIRKHETTAAVLALLITLSLAGTGVFFTIVREKSVALDIANSELQEKIRSLETSQKQSREAAARSDAVNKFLVDDLLKAASPDQEPERELSLRTVLDRAGSKVEERFRDQPNVEAELHYQLYSVYYSLGEYQRAEKHERRRLELEREVDKFSADSLGAMCNIAGCLKAQGRLAEARTLYEETLTLMREHLGAEHEFTLNCEGGLALIHRSMGQYEAAETLYEQILETRRRVLGPEHPSCLDAEECLALLYDDQRRYGDAEALYERIVESRRRLLGPEHPSTLLSASNLANIYRNRERFTEAESLYQQTLDAQRQVLGPEHPHTLWTQRNLAVSYFKQKRYSEAEVLCQQTLDAERRVLGLGHPNTLMTQGNLASLYVTQNRHAEAEVLYQQTLDAQQRVLGPEHPNTLMTQGNLASLYVTQNRHAEAEPLYRQVLSIRQRLLGEQHQDTLGSLTALADCCWDYGRIDEARALYQQGLELDDDSGNFHNGWAWRLVRDRLSSPEDVAEGVALARQACERNPDNRHFRHTLGTAHYRAGDWTAAHEALMKSLSPEGDDIYSWLLLAMTCRQQGDQLQAHEWYQKAVDRNQPAKPNAELQAFFTEAEELLGIRTELQPEKSTDSTPPSE